MFIRTTNFVALSEYIKVITSKRLKILVIQPQGSDFMSLKLWTLSRDLFKGKEKTLGPNRTV